MSNADERKVIMELLEMYKNLPCLWDTLHVKYRDKDEKLQAWRILLQKWKTVDSEANIDTLKKKIDNLKSSFTREWKKVELSKLSGRNDEIYKPLLYYYNYLTFLYENRTPNETKVLSRNKSTDKTQIHGEDQIQFQSEISQIAFVDSSSDDNEDEQESEIHEKEIQYRIKKPRREEFLPEEVKIEDVMSNSSQINSSHFVSVQEDATDTFMRSMTMQLKDMSRLQKCVAEKLISDVIFYGKLDQLAVNSTISNLGSNATVRLPHVSSQGSERARQNKLRKSSSSS